MGEKRGGPSHLRATLSLLSRYRSTQDLATSPCEGYPHKQELEEVGIFLWAVGSLASSQRMKDREVLQNQRQGQRGQVLRVGPVLCPRFVEVLTSMHWGQCYRAEGRIPRWGAADKVGLALGFKSKQGLASGLGLASSQIRPGQAHCPLGPLGGCSGLT